MPHEESCQVWCVHALCMYICIRRKMFPQRQEWHKIFPLNHKDTHNELCINLPLDQKTINPLNTPTAMCAMTFCSVKDLEPYTPSIMADRQASRQSDEILADLKIFNFCADCTSTVIIFSDG